MIPYYDNDTGQLTLHPWGVSEIRDVPVQPYHNRNDRLWKAVLEDLISRGLDRVRQRNIFEFINHIVPFKKAETQRLFEQSIQKRTGGKTTMGIEEFLLEEAS